MATLYKRGERYYLNWREEGVQYRRTLGKIDRKAAEALCAEKAAELRGLITPTRGVLVGDVLDDYLKWYEKARPTTYKRAVSALRGFRATFNDQPAEGLAPRLIERWIPQQTATGQTEKALKLARAAFRRAIAQREISRSPLDGVSIPKPVTSRAPDYYRPEQLAKLADTQHAAVWIFMVNTGIRRGEMVKATGADIREGKLYVESVPTGRTKNLRWRAIPISPAAKRALRSLGRDRLIECHADTLGDWFTAEARSVGLRGTLHWLRHTFCTALVQSGESLHTVKQLAGHSSITVTEQYAHHAPGHGDSAIKAMGKWMRVSSNVSTKKRRKP